MSPPTDSTDATIAVSATDERLDSEISEPRTGSEEKIAEAVLDLTFSGVSVLLGLVAFICFVLSGALAGTGYSVPLLTAGGALLGSIAFFQALKKFLKSLDAVLSYN